jgi:hypothetical protein
MKLRFCLRLRPQILSLGLSLLLALAGLALGLSVRAEALIADPAVQTAVDPERLFRSAYSKRYTWDPDFPGYWVEVSVRYNQDIYHGLATVKPDLSVEVANMNSLTDAHNATVAELVKNELQMEVIHRRSLPFEQLHGQSQFELEGQDQTRAWQIRELGDGISSYYKIQDQKIIQVNRMMEDVAVTVDTLGFERPPEGYMAAHFQTTFRNPETGEDLEMEDVRDSHTKVGKYYLLTNRSIRRLEPGEANVDRGDDILIRFDHPLPIPSPEK